MSEENKQIIVNRGKSFLWRLASMVVVSILGFIGENLGLFNLNPQIVVVIGLVLGEVTKYLNSN